MPFNNPVDSYKEQYGVNHASSLQPEWAIKLDLALEAITSFHIGYLLKGAEALSKKITHNPAPYEAAWNQHVEFNIYDDDPTTMIVTMQGKK